jgi:hypothetical protein
LNYSCGYARHRLPLVAKTLQVGSIGEAVGDGERRPSPILFSALAPSAYKNLFIRLVLARVTVWLALPMIRPQPLENIGAPGRSRARSRRACEPRRA